MYECANTCKHDKNRFTVGFNLVELSSIVTAFANGQIFFTWEWSVSEMGVVGGKTKW